MTWKILLQKGFCMYILHQGTNRHKTNPTIFHFGPSSCYNFHINAKLQRAHMIFITIFVQLSITMLLLNKIIGEGKHKDPVFRTTGLKHQLRKKNLQQLSWNTEKNKTTRNGLNKSPLICPPSLLPLLTVCDLKQCFGNDTAGDVESLAAVEAAIRALNISNGQTAHLRDRLTAEELGRLVREEETLEREREIYMTVKNTFHWLYICSIVVIQCDDRLWVSLTSLPSLCQKIAGCGLPVASHWKVTVLPTATTWFLGRVVNAGGTAEEVRH